VTGPAIGDYGVLSDCHSAALSANGSIDWLCFPRFDSPSVFARILDPGGGHWSIQPTGNFSVTRRYVEGSLILETSFHTSGGSATLTEAQVFEHNSRGHDIGRDAPHALVRVLEVTHGSMAVSAEFCPRPEYGIVHPRLEQERGRIIARGGASILWLDGPSPTGLDAGMARWDLDLAAGDRLVFTLHCTQSWLPAPDHWSDREARRRLRDTLTGWESWSKLHQRYRGPAETLVRHSGRVLQGLMYQPTGAIVAAASSSLPELAGGSRNWDYRYAWIRDASFTLKALWIAACPDEAGRFLTWIVKTAGSSLRGEHGLQIMYGVGGEHDLSERELVHLAGWRDSRPVRVGNDAWNQIQIDIYGELLDAVLRLQPELEAPTESVRRFLTDVADRAAASWTAMDAGIWESRGEPRHHVYSKLMCWVALDRALQLGVWLQADERISTWQAARRDIREAILTRGWSEAVGSFTQCFDDTNLDASSLMLAITGFISVDDPKMSATIDRLTNDLAAPCGLLYRYSDDDGIEGDEGCFILCTYWLVECLAAQGHLERANELFERTNSFASDLGLLSEEAEPRTGELLGNFPQALSHVGLINAAWALSQHGSPPT
jgi:GH15 family glucan-1,4-alpha-glucosidase